MSLHSPSSSSPLRTGTFSVFQSSPAHLRTVGLQPVWIIKGHELSTGRSTYLQKKLKLVARLNGTVGCAAGSSSTGKEIGKVRGNTANRLEPFRGNSGSVTFRGVTHQSIEESQLVSAPFESHSGSFVWMLGPVVLISSLVLPLFFFGVAIEDFFRNEVASEIITSFVTEVAFYIGLATYLRLTDHVQKPYMEFSAKRWSLITGLRGYLTSAFFTMGFKISAPLLAVYVTWPVLGLPALVSVAPFLVGCLAQYAFERYLDKRGSSCWPLAPIIFEVYRIYQLTRAAHFLQKLMLASMGASVTPALVERNGAVVSLIVTLQILGAVCLWSLLTFLLRLFPSRPVAENY